MAVPYYLELPPAYSSTGMPMTPVHGEQISDVIMCSVCRCLINRNNQTDHTNDHRLRDLAETELATLRSWKDSLIQCPECFILYPGKDQRAHQIHHAYIEEMFDALQKNRPALTYSTAAISTDELFDALEPKPPTITTKATATMYEDGAYTIYEFTTATGVESYRMDSTSYFHS